MVRNHSTRPTLLTAALVLVSIVSSLGSIVSRGDPSVSDNGNGTKTAVWDFTNPANYTAANIAMAPNDAMLRPTPGEWKQTSDADFALNGTRDAAVNLSNDSMQLRGTEVSLIANGDFSRLANWSWQNGTSGTLGARQNQGTGEFHHSTLNNSSRYDSMDTLTWGFTGSPGASSSVSLSPATKVQGAAS